MTGIKVADAEERPERDRSPIKRVPFTDTPQSRGNRRDVNYVTAEELRIVALEARDARADARFAMGMAMASLTISLGTLILLFFFAN